MCIRDRVIIKSVTATEEHNVQYKSNGAEVMEVGSTDKIQMSVKLENDKLSFCLLYTSYSVLPAHSIIRLTNMLW